MKEWILVNNNVRPLDLAQGNAMHYVVLDLKPRTPYVLRITAHNSAGSTVKEYKFSTLGKVMRVGSNLYYYVSHLSSSKSELVTY